jgi:hypothetical protein
VWSAIEPGLGITAGSLATLRPFLRRLMPRSFGSAPLDSSSTFPSRMFGGPLGDQRSTDLTSGSGVGGDSDYGPNMTFLTTPWPDREARDKDHVQFVQSKV